MDRSFLLVVGAIAWTAVAFEILIHVAFGNLLVPGAMAALFLAWIAYRRAPIRRVALRAVRHDEADDRA